MSGPSAPGGLVDWCTSRARMILALIVISLAAGFASYVSLPKEGAPDIDIPVLYVSATVPGISAADSERLIVRPLEEELRGIADLDEILGIASEGRGSVLLSFDFGWDKQATLATVRDRVDRARADFPEAAEEPTITETNLSQFPVIVVSLSGAVPERTLLRLAKDLQRSLEGITPVLEAKLTGHREEMVEVLVDPLKLESYDITGQALLEIVERNNQLVAADRVQSGTAAFSVKVPGSFEGPEEIYNLPLKTNGDRIVRLSDMADIRLTFEDPSGRARYNGRNAISLQVSKRIGENIIDTVAEVRTVVARETARWPEPLRNAVAVDLAMDESREVVDMVGQLENSVATAVLLVMIVVLATLGPRAALLVGFAIPCSFLLSFALMAALGLGVNNMVMFGLILAVGMLVDGAIVVVEYADKRIAEGTGPMRAYAEAAKRMFWPIVASTGTTLCAFLPMLLWPGLPGEFMGQLPVTLIFVLSASLIAALVFLPVLGGLAGRLSRTLGRLLPGRAAPPRLPPRGRTRFGRLLRPLIATPFGPVAVLVVSIGAIVAIFSTYASQNAGVEFFVKTEPQRAIVYVRARGNMSLEAEDRLVREVERRILDVEGVRSVFAFSGEGGLASQGGDEPVDAIGQVQIELLPWDARGPGDAILAEIERRVADLPGIIAEVKKQAEGPQQGKPVQLELAGPDFATLLAAAETAREKFDATPGLVNIDDTRPLPGIEWQIRVDRLAAGRDGADIATVGPLVQLVTRGVTLDTIRLEGSDDEIDIRARFPEEDRRLATLDAMRVSTDMGLVPLAHFIERGPAPEVAEINRRNGERYFLVRADVDETTTDVAAITALEAWIAEEAPFPETVRARFTGDREEQQESLAFLATAFAGALGLMFVILLAQFNSVYNAALVLSAVVMSVAGVLVGMLVMDQKFSIIMTGTGILALAGIVVNNNIVLIDAYQEFARRMDPLEAILKTAEARLRPVLLTTVTTMAGLTPMMFATSLDFAAGTVVWGAPTALWWVQLSTAVVFGLGLATGLTLVVTPAALALRVWIARGAYRGGAWVAQSLGLAGRETARRARADRALARRLAIRRPPEILWEAPEDPVFPARRVPFIRAAE
ncbi:MAG: efflux RND transporter permease subunit [Paracoccaceae bacterium]